MSKTDIRHHSDADSDTIGCPTCRAWARTLVERGLTPSPDSSCSDCGAQEIAVYTAIRNETIEADRAEGAN